MTPALRFPSEGRKRRRSRGSTTARGYGHSHQLEKDRWRPIAAGCRCTKCGELIGAAAWDLDHTENRKGYLGVAHRFKKDCPAGGNYATRKPRRQSRQW